MTAKPLVIILMGSKADMEHCTKISDACKGFGLDTVLRIGSAHKTPEHALSILKEYEADERRKVYITVAGRSNALSGFTDGRSEEQIRLTSEIARLRSPGARSFRASRASR